MGGRLLPANSGPEDFAVDSPLATELHRAGDLPGLKQSVEGKRFELHNFHRLRRCQKGVFWHLLFVPYCRLVGFRTI